MKESLAIIYWTSVASNDFKYLLLLFVLSEQSGFLNPWSSSLCALTCLEWHAERWRALIRSSGKASSPLFCFNPNGKLNVWRGQKELCGVFTKMLSVFLLEMIWLDEEKNPIRIQMLPLALANKSPRCSALHISTPVSPFFWPSVTLWPEY